MATSKRTSQRYREKDPQLVYELLPKIEHALKATLGLHVEDAVRYLDQGENLTFKVITDQGKVMVRIFRFPTWPDRETLRFADATAKTRKYPILERLYLDDSDTYFPYGFSVREWRDGLVLNQLYTLDLWSRYQVLEVIGKLLRKVHFSQKRFGFPPFRQDRPGYASFLESQLAEIHSPGIKELINQKRIDPIVVGEVEQMVQALIQATPGKITPFFSHGDPEPTNVLLTDRGSILIDWEGARSSSWAYDFSVVTFWWGSNSIRDLLDAYQPTKEQEAQFDYLEIVHHLGYSVHLLPYFFSMQDQENFDLHLQRLQENIARARRLLQDTM